MQKTFELIDGQGQAHQYRMTAHPASEGCLIAHAMTTEAVGPLVEMVARAIMEQGDIDIAKMTPHLGSLIAALDPRKQRDLLKYTARDGVLLGEKMHFDAAFEANYGEWMHALIRVVLENQFVPLGYISGVFQRTMANPKAVEEMMDSLLKLLPAEMRAQVAEKAAE